MVFQECDIDSVDTLVEIGRETYFDTFASMNTKETMNAYLDEAFDSEKIRSEIKTPQSRFFILIENEIPAAYFKINTTPAQTDLNDPQSLELERIYVRERFKGNGLGKLIIQKVETIARERSCRYVWLGVWEKNEKAISFYKKMGFEPFKTHMFPMGDELQRDLILKKTLG